MHLDGQAEVVAAMAPERAMLPTTAVMLAATAAVAIGRIRRRAPNCGRLQRCGPLPPGGWRCPWQLRAFPQVWRRPVGQNDENVVAAATSFE